MASNSWRQSIWSKFLAGGFIVLILLGQVWFVESFRAKGSPLWLQWAFLVTVFWIFVNACGLAVFFVRQRRETENGENDTPL